MTSRFENIKLEAHLNPRGTIPFVLKLVDDDLKSLVNKKKIFSEVF